ncbi:hypothetical protein K439DRAFT_519140 [Ramaria rubella]|nr:hypothetical protein K439DRAFT_519140 [Ramaria rubella]
MHYRRASQIRALSNVLSSGASRPLSGAASDESHAFSGETYHSSDPLNILPFTNPFLQQRAVSGPSEAPSQEHTNGYPNVIPFPQNSQFAPPSNPFSNHSMQSIAESSPSIYPPTLPSVADENEDIYWQHQAFEDIPELHEASEMAERPKANHQPTLPKSALGLWTNTSEVTLKPYSSSTISEENELVRSLHPRMEPSSIHRGTTAPITSLPRLNMQEGRYPSLSGNWTVSLFRLSV